MFIPPLLIRDRGVSGSRRSADTVGAKVEPDHQMKSVAIINVITVDPEESMNQQMSRQLLRDFPQTWWNDQPSQITIS